MQIIKWTVAGLCCFVIGAGVEFASAELTEDEGSVLMDRTPQAARRKRTRRRKKFKKRVVIDFQDELIEGSASTPGIFHLFHKKQLNYGRLIKFRKNFLPEMRRTAREL